MFQYPPVVSPTSIRVLILYPGAREEEIEISIVLDDLESQKHDYEALSYFWGPPVFSRKIRANGNYLDITETLYDALVRLRLPDKDRVIWADAICVDQNSALEKNHQVTLMSRIYTQCSRGVIYLGPEADGSELLYDFFGYLMDWLTRDAWSENPAWKRGVNLTMANSLYEGIPPDDDARWHALRTFLQRPWFRRLWIMQEFALPKDLITICGEWELDGTYLSTFMVTFTQATRIASFIGCDVDEIAFRKIRNAITLMRHHLSIRIALGHRWNQIDPGLLKETLKGKSVPQHHLHMMDLVTWARICEVADPRDRYFGLLGLAIDLDDDQNLMPNYNKSIKEVQDAYYALFIRQGYGCQILARAHPPPVLDLSQPSWMDTWNGDDDDGCNLSSAKLSQAVLIPIPDRQRTTVSQISNRDLAVHCFKIDQLHIMTTKSNSIDLEILDEVLGLSLPFSSPSSGESFERIVLRILMLNKTNLEIEPAPDDFLDLCERYVEVMIRHSIPFENAVGGHLIEGFLGMVEELSHAANALLNSSGACFGMTKEGYYGMFPPVARDADQVIIMEGTADTFLVRHQPDTDTYIWLGKIYVHDFEQQVQKSLAPDNRTTIVVR